MGAPSTAVLTTTSAVVSAVFPFAFSPWLPLARMCSPVTASTYLRVRATLPRLPMLRASLTRLICPTARGARSDDYIAAHYDVSKHLHLNVAFGNLTRPHRGRLI